MRYDYKCTQCDTVWEEVQFMNDRDLPLTLPCPHCQTNGTVKRGIFKTARVSYAGSKTVLQRAGSGWNDVLTSIKRASGRKSTIETR
jgi:putative FmdB family regulatory protein